MSIVARLCMFMYYICVQHKDHDTLIDIEDLFQDHSPARRY